MTKQPKGDCAKVEMSWREAAPGERGTEADAFVATLGLGPAKAAADAPSPDVLLVSGAHGETPVDLMDDDSWGALDPFQPGAARLAASREWSEAAVRRLSNDRTFAEEVEWLADMGNDAAQHALREAREPEPALD